MKNMLLALLITLSLGVHAGTMVEVTGVIDGDTIKVNIPRWPEVVGVDIPIRIRGIDTPEIHGKCDRERQLSIIARKLVFNVVTQVRYIELRNIERGSFFRLIADVYVDDVNIAGLLLTRGLAHKYDGKNKRGWCDENNN